MKSALKVILPLGLLLGVVFAVTYMSRYTPVDDTVTNKQKAGNTPSGQGLEFFTATRKWDPATFTQIFEPESKVSLQDVAFPGFYEPGETVHPTQFWFRTRSPGKLTLRLMKVSCNACSGGRVAPIPQDAVRGLLQMTAVSALPVGPIAACPGGMAGAGAVLTSKLEWQAHAFNADPKTIRYDIPPAPSAGDPWDPGWGILELNFKVKPNPSVPLMAAFATYDESDQPVSPDTFSITFAAVQAAEVDKSRIDAGVLADNTPGQTHRVTVFSSTRPAGELPGLTARVVNPAGGDAGPFVTAGRPERVPDAELREVEADLTAKAGHAVRVRSAYRVPVTVAAKVGNARPDIGPFEREVWIDPGVPGTDPRKVAVRATVTGPVALTGGAVEVNLGTVRHQAGGSETVRLTTDSPDATLEVVPGAVRPDILEVSLKRLPPAGGRGQWEMTLRAPPGRLQGEITDGIVVLELKGPTPHRIRIPVRGRGVL